MLKPVFINYWDFSSPSGMHIFHLSNALTDIGHECTVYCCTGQPDTVARYGKPRFRCTGEAEISIAALAAELRAGKGDYLVHSWTPREIPRRATLELAALLDAPHLVHMEDNEEAIFTNNSENKGDDPSLWEAGGCLSGFSHPVRYREFLNSAQGFTCIAESLLDFKPDHVPGMFFWPACEKEVFSLPRLSTPEAKARWGIAPDAVTVFYPGNVHASNMRDVHELYVAVGMLHRAGTPMRLITYGNYSAEVAKAVFGELETEECLVDLTERVTPAMIPDIMQAADLLVQPGHYNTFNKYRFPCKIPLFLASARPTILPEFFLKGRLTHGKNCLLHKENKPDELSSLMLYLVRYPARATAIGMAGRAFAAENFSWEKSAASLSAFYHDILESWKKTGRRSDA